MNDLLTLDNEQEALKARLKEKTPALLEKTTLAEKKMSELKKLVKLELPQETWKEFGIADKR